MNSPVFIGSSRAVIEIKNKIHVIAKLDTNVLIMGETGTGKEVLARYIHSLRKLKDTPFVAINCGGMPKELFENELFGHKKGAYSNATEDRRGLVEECGNGTLFLDEIDSLPFDMQPKILRLLQEREFRSVGDSRIKKARGRFVAAAGMDLDDLVREKTFRADLYYRLTVFSIRLPPLRARKADIPFLLEHFLNKYSHDFGKPNLQPSKSLMPFLTDYDWPGNIRELEHATQRALAWCPGPLLEPKHYELACNGNNHFAVGEGGTYHELKEQMLNRFEKEFLSTLLETSNGNVTRAAENAGLDRRTLQRLMTKHQLKRTIKPHD